MRIDGLRGIKNDLIFLSSLACVRARCFKLARSEGRECACASFLWRVRRNAPQQEACVFLVTNYSVSGAYAMKLGAITTRSAFPPTFLFFSQFSLHSHERELDFSPWPLAPPSCVYCALISFILIKNKQPLLSISQLKVVPH